MKKILPVLIAGLSLLALGRRAGAITIVRDGHAEAVIVVPAGLKASAADDLQKYVEKASGAKLDIVSEDKLGEAKSGARIFVGPCQAASRVVNLEKLQPEGFVIKTDADDLFIVGKDVTDTGMQVTGTLYGVYEFLERYLGVRWVMDGPLGEVVPKTQNVDVASANVRQEPLLWMRGNPSRDDPSIVYEPGSWFVHQRIGNRVKLISAHAYLGYWEKYHVQYPEIFALQPNGTRVQATGGDEDGETRARLCESNPTLWKLVAEDKMKELRAHPDLLAISISENDGGRNMFCSCATCRSWDSPEDVERFKTDPKLYTHQESGLASDRIFRFSTEIAKLMEKELPGRGVCMYAYSTYQKAPVGNYPPAPDNLFIGYVGFGDGEYINDVWRAEQRQDWLGWSKLCKHMWLRPNLGNGPLGLPIIYVHKIADDLRFMAEHGMGGATYADGAGTCWGTQGLDYYVLAKSLWDPLRNVDQVIDDYCRASFGAGAPAMKEYYRRAEDLTNRIAATGKPNRDLDLRLNHVRNKLTDHFTEAELAKLQTCVDEAATAIGSSDPAASGRVQLVATGLEYTRKTRDLLAAAAAVRAGKSTREEFNQVKAATDSYYKTLDGSLAVQPVTRGMAGLITLKADQYDN